MRGREQEPMPETVGAPEPRRGGPRCGVVHSGRAGHCTGLEAVGSPGFAALAITRPPSRLRWRFLRARNRLDLVRAKPGAGMPFAQ